MTKFDKYFTYFLIVMIVFSIGLLGYAGIIGSFNTEMPESFNIEILSIVFSFGGYMIGMMITLGILLAYEAVSNKEKREKMTKEEEAKHYESVVGAAFFGSILWPALIVYFLFYYIFMFFAKQKMDEV